MNFKNKKKVSGRFRRTPGYYEHRCDSYKKQASVPVQTFGKVLFEANQR